MPCRPKKPHAAELRKHGRRLKYAQRNNKSCKIIREFFNFGKLFFVRLQKEHEKCYKDDEEESFRKSVFLENKRKIDKHNELYENGEVTYSMKMNRFGDLVGIFKIFFIS